MARQKISNPASSYVKTDPPDLVAAAQPMREGRKPLGCHYSSPCWVLDGRRSLTDTGFGSIHRGIPRCIGCGGKPRL